MKRWKWMLLLVAVLGLVGLGIGFVSLRAYGERAWEEVRKEIDVLQRDFEHPAKPRPVLWGEATEGNAFTDYEKALAMLRARTDLLDALPDERAAEDPRTEDFFEDPARTSEAMWKFIEEIAPVLELVRAGAHRTTATRTVDWYGGFEGTTIPNLPTVQDLSEYIRMRAWLDQRNGEPEEAVRWLLDGIQFGSDLAADPTLLGTLVGATIVAGQLTLLAAPLDSDEDTLPFTARLKLESIPASVRETLAAAVRDLDRDFVNFGRAYRAEIVNAARTVDLYYDNSQDLSGLKLSWRFAWSLGWTAATGVRQMMTQAERVQETPRAELPELLSKQLQEIKDSRNPILMLFAPSLSDTLTSEQRFRVTIRVARMVLGDTAMEDPFGKNGDKILSAVVDGRTRYWSRGEDGVDNGGDPEHDLVYVR